MKSRLINLNKQFMEKNTSSGNQFVQREKPVHRQPPSTSLTCCLDGFVPTFIYFPVNVSSNKIHDKVQWPANVRKYVLLGGVLVPCIFLVAASFRAELLIFSVRCLCICRQLLTPHPRKKSIQTWVHAFQIWADLTL